MDVIIVWLIKAQDSTLTCLAVLKVEMLLGVQLVVVLIVDVDRHAEVGARKVPELERRQSVDLHPAVVVAGDHLHVDRLLLVLSYAMTKI